MTDPSAFLPAIRAIHARIRAAVVASCEAQSVEALADVSGFAGGDTIYAIDKVSEALLIELVEAEIASSVPVMLIAEGLPEGRLALPRGTADDACRLTIIVDPIDGTRGLMYQKRSAWILSGIGPWSGSDTCLRDLVAAVQTEIPLVKQHLSDVLWATRGQGASGERFNRLDGSSAPLPLQPSQATTPAHGFAMLSRFFPGGRDLLGGIDDRLMTRVLGPVQAGQAPCFEDQYISSGGQFAELAIGHDRFNADLRPLLEPILQERGQSAGLACHPYDVCTALILEELGIHITDGLGQALDAPLNVEAPVAWIAYANEQLRAVMEPALVAELEAAGLR